MSDVMCAACPNCRGHMYEFPKVVCLVGSMRFAEQFTVLNAWETMAGRIVLAPGVDTKTHAVTGEQKAALDSLHLRKIDMADEILVVNPGGYIGESTRREILYAVRRRKVIRWVVPMDPSLL